MRRRGRNYQRLFSKICIFFTCSTEITIILQLECRIRKRLLLSAFRLSESEIYTKILNGKVQEKVPCRSFMCVDYCTYLLLFGFLKI